MGGFVAPQGIMPNAASPLTGNEASAWDSNLPNGISPQTVRITTSQLAAYLGGLPAWVTGRFYGLPIGATLASVLTVTGTLYAYPISIPNAVTVASLNLSVGTGQTGGAAHLGIYADNGAGYPGALVYDATVTGLTTTAVATNTPAANSVVLNPGVYWLASIFTATSTFPSVIGATAVYTGELSNSIGYDTAAHALATSGQAATGIQVAATYGALPATFPTGATVTLNATTPVFSLGV